MDVLSENTTAVYALNNMNSCKSLLCDQEVEKIRSRTIERDIFITAAQKSGILSKDVDLESRIPVLGTK